ncbi:FMN-linked oxidoreductase [Rhizopus microsporus var. microsporus]|uniref:tRNA-dihydrouridine(47) synthase [NAD(P)(+)] n=1 Tax=Rhizopus microsporus var. microsporus TaxID=86635 RepID=A0A1X0R7Y8_RHIZD|nr:FMN-linked oxidoreductase [Rhizopus microsporus var. microsporus]
MSEPKPGEALIKPEYRKERWFSDAETAVNDDEAEGASTIEPKKQKNARGANKGQRGKKRIEDSVRLCKYVAVDEECKIGEKCRFSHDLEAYLAAKPADIGNRCVNFDLFGKCSYGYKCRFLSAHMDENKKLIVDEKKMAENNVYTINGISHETQVALNRSKYKFPRTEAYMATVKVEIAEEQAMKDANALKRKLQSSSEEQKGIKKQKSDESNDSEDDEFFDASNEFTNVSIEPAAAEAPTNQEDKPIGPIDLKYKKIIDFRNKTYLAPLTTVGNLPFRRVCKEYGVDITCGEMALAFNLLQGQQSEWALTKRHKSEDIFGIQICGSKVEQVTKACEVLNNEVDVDFIDLNMGCPIDLVFKQTVTDIPITAKFRMGIKDNYPIADRVVPKLEELLHGRSRAQRYTRKADWEYIGTMKQLTNSMPLYGNGDIMSFEDYNRCKEISGVDGVMIGRGALIKPWIFDEIKNQRHYDISANERFDMLKRFCDYGLEHWGSDSQGVNITRRFFCEWQSFLYRYIPVGILERPPQRMNERPPPFQGRNDLETLMASPLASDWVKLSELFLGPAPEDFKFVPKHKANSFETIQV